MSFQSPRAMDRIGSPTLAGSTAVGRVRRALIASVSFELPRRAGVWPIAARAKPGRHWSAYVFRHREPTKSA